MWLNIRDLQPVGEDEVESITSSQKDERTLQLADSEELLAHRFNGEHGERQNRTAKIGEELEADWPSISRFSRH